jgi:hypothetical protein
MEKDGTETVAGIKILIPTGAIDAAPQRLATRLTTLKGARIALLDNCKEFADLVLKGVAEIIEREYEVKELRFWRKGYPAKGAPFIKELAASCDAVINGVGH